MVNGPLKPLDAETVRKLKLPEWCLSFESLAAQLGMSTKTLKRRRDEDVRVDAAIKSLLADQICKAKDIATRETMERMKDRKDPESGKMLIWFMKCYLGFSDRVTNIQENDINVNINRSEIPMPDPPKDADAASES